MTTGVVDGWVNIFRASSDDPVPTAEGDLGDVAELFGGGTAQAWMTTTIDDVLTEMDLCGVDGALVTVGDPDAVIGPGTSRPAPLATGLTACATAPERFRLVLQVEDVTSPHAAAAMVRRRAGAHPEIIAVGVFPGDLHLDLNDRRLYPVYDACVDHGLAVRVNVGVAGPLVSSRHQHPALLEEVLLDFPDLTVIACHMGHPYEALLISLMMKFRRLYLMSSGYLATYFDPALVRFMGSSRGIGRVLFGSDHPGIPLGRALTAARELPLDDPAMDAFLGRSLCDVIGWK